MTELNEKSGRVYPYGKLKIILQILRELNLCEYTEPTEDHYFIELNANPAKTDLENSSILRDLRARMQPSAEKESL